MRRRIFLSYCFGVMFAGLASPVAAAASRDVTLQLGHSFPVYEVAYSPDGARIVSRSSNGTLKLWEAETGRLIRTLKDSNWSVGIAYSPDGARIVSGSRDKTLKLWEAKTGRLIRTFGVHPSYVRAVAYSPDGVHIVAGSSYGILYVWEAKTGRLIRTLEGDVSYGLIDIRAVAYSPEGVHIVAGRSNGTLNVWEAKTGRLIRGLEGHSGEVSAVAYAPDGQRLVSGSWDKTLKLWETKTGRLIRTLEGHSGGVNAVAYAPDGAHIVSGSSDGTLKLWDANSGQLVATFMEPQKGQWIVLTPEGFFDASKKSADLLTVVDGDDVYAIDQFYQALYRPDLVREKLAGDPDGLVKAAAAKLDMDKVVKTGSAPEVLIRSPKPGTKAASEQIEVEVELIDRGGGAGRIEWRANGVTLGVGGERGLVRLEDSAATKKSKRVRHVLTLEPGENTIEVVAYNAANLIASMPAKVTVTLPASASTTPPRLYVLAVGVNDYYDSRLKLNYAVPDAKRLAEAFRKAGKGHYETVEVTMLTDTEVSAERLEEAFVSLSQKVRARDVLVFFAAGHGKTVDGRYYFIPRDFRYQTEASLGKDAIGQDEWQAWFAMIPARKSILIYDTCESGTLTGSPGEQVVATRSGLEQAAALGRLIQATGRTVLTAATSDAPALEGYKGHGVFTYALLDGLARADNNGNGLIEVTELAGHVDGLVPEITQKAFGIRQVPQMSIQGSDFALVKKVKGILTDGATPTVPEAAPPAASPPSSNGPTHVILQLVNVFAEPEGQGEPVTELEPGTMVSIVNTKDGWTLIKRGGNEVGYVEEAKVQRLQ